MNIIDSLQWRYATKKFDTERRLSKDQINILKNAFNLTATSFGLQTIKMVIVEEKAIRKPLIQHSFDQAQVWQASHLLIICIHKNITDADVDAHFDNVHEIRDTPESILKPYREDLKVMMQNMSVEERREWSIKQAYIALGNLMTVCAVEEIDACPMEGFIAESYDKAFDLKAKNLQSILLLPVGYRAKDDMFAGFKKVRKSLDETVFAHG